MLFAETENCANKTFFFFLYKLIVEHVLKVYFLLATISSVILPFYLLKFTSHAMSHQKMESLHDGEDPLKTFVKQGSKGFTGETWYDFDLPLERTDPINIIHFNDVYNINEQDGYGGVARFVSAINEQHLIHPLTLFSGDAFNPSMMSTFTRGRHMIPFLNLLKIHTAVFGNHDFDFGIDELEYRIGSTNFPWILSNVFEKKNDIILEEGGLSALDTFGNHPSKQSDTPPKEKQIPSGTNSMDYLCNISITPASSSSISCKTSRDPSPSKRLLASDGEEHHSSNNRHMLTPPNARSCVSPKSSSAHSNIVDVDILSGEPLANGCKYRIFEWQGVRVGIIGLVEMEWLDTLAYIDMEDVTYVDFVTAGNKLCQLLREKEVELIIALTHMRAPNDERLAREVSDIDIILGGHDHDYYGVQSIDGIPICKSGTDFREFTTITILPGVTPNDPAVILNKNSGSLKVMGGECGGTLFLPKFMQGSTLIWKKVECSLYPKNEHVENLVHKYENHLQGQMQKTLGEVGCDLETRFRIIRREESNVGNWLCDIMRRECKTDIALLNSGTIRSDRVFHPGPFRYGDLAALLPMADNLVVLKCTGKCIVDALENSVSKIPKTEGRFFQISGLKFKFDSSKPPGERVIKKSVKVLRGSGGGVLRLTSLYHFSALQLNTETLPSNPTTDLHKSAQINDNEDYLYVDIDPNEFYTVATKTYCQQGRDGFDMFQSCSVLVEEELLPPLPTMVRNVLSLTALANGYKKPHSKIMYKKLTTFQTLGSEELRHDFGCQFLNSQHCVLCPIKEGRIVDVNPNKDYQ